MKIEKINPFDIKVPDVRVTSTWDPEMLEMFKKSVETSGIEQPLYLLKDGEILWLVDGLHRLEEAKLKGMKTIDCVVNRGKLKDVHMKNLMLNRLRGGTKASEMVAVINDLYKKHKVTIEDIVKKTGLRRDYIDNMLAIGSAHHEIWEALDMEEIGVGHAYQLSRIADAAVQLKLLHQTRVYKIKVADLKDIIDETIEIIKQKEQAEKHKEVMPVPKPKLATCHFCTAEADPRKMAAPVMCMSCYGYLMGQVQQAKVEAEKAAKAKTATITVKTKPETTADMEP